MWLAWFLQWIPTHCFCYINALISHFSLWQIFLVLGPGKAGLSFPGQVRWDAYMAPHQRKGPWRIAWCQSRCVSFIASVLHLHLLDQLLCFCFHFYSATMYMDSSRRRCMCWTRISFIWSTTFSGIWDSKRKLRQIRLCILYLLHVLCQLYQLYVIYTHA